ncbi:glycoprotein-polysaccharide metabolism [Klebsiella pneumoniae]|nr:glycoprotein-polysaccharide metabolism [Klebsiella pneumoniae]
MKFAYMFSALAVAATLTACANHHSNNSSTQAARARPLRYRDAERGAAAAERHGDD